MAILMGKYNNYLSSLQKAIESRKIKENANENEMDIQREALTLKYPEKRTTNTCKQNAVDNFEQEYLAFVDKLRNKKLEKESAKPEMIDEPNIAASDNIGINIEPEVIKESTTDDVSVNIPVTKKRSKKTTVKTETSENTTTEPVENIE